MGPHEIHLITVETPKIKFHPNLLNSFLD